MNAPTMFQQFMTRLFSGKDWPFVFVYLDDYYSCQILVNHSFSGQMQANLAKLDTELSWSREGQIASGHQFHLPVESLMRLKLSVLVFLKTT